MAVRAMVCPYGSRRLHASASRTFGKCSQFLTPSHHRGFIQAARLEGIEAVRGTQVTVVRLRSTTICGTTGAGAVDIIGLFGPNRRLTRRTIGF